MRAKLCVSRIGGPRLSTRARLAMFLARSPMRSSSLAILMAARVSRRSTAMGWRRASSFSAWSSMVCCSWSMRGSPAMADSASAVSRRAMASTASANCASARPPIWATALASASSCSVKALTVCSLIQGSRATGVRSVCFVAPDRHGHMTDLYHFCDSGEGLIFGRGRRKEDCDGAALAQPAVDGEPALVAVDDVLDDGQAEPGAAPLPAPLHVHPIETLGEPRDGLARDAFAVVADHPLDHEM